MSISIYLMYLGLYFMGIAYLLVYVGAISILFLFILMLINIRVSELLTEGENSVPLAVISIFLINYCIEYILPYCSYIINILNNIFIILENTITKVFINLDLGGRSLIQIEKFDFEAGNVNSKAWDGIVVENTHIASIGNILYSNLLIFIIIISLILLLAMVGSIVITVKK